MGNIAVSIIVPVYRTPIPLLQRFLKSALNQTLSDIQLIAVDDASPDECPKILDTVAAKDERMTVIHRETNGRAGVARGDGMKLAKGNYIFFADADDIMQPDMCETLFGLAVKHDADIVSCSWSISDQDGQLVGRHCLPNRKYSLSFPRHKAAAYRGLNYALWNKIFRREVVVPLRFEQFEANIGEDTHFNVAALCRSHIMVTTAYCGYDYIVHTTSATGRSSKGMPYLRTLALSAARIKQTLMARGDSVDKRFADRLALKRFTTGCGWIAEYPDPTERAAMWEYWRGHLREHVLPNLESCRLLAAWYRLVTAMVSPQSAYRLTRIATRITDPLSFVDRLEARMAARRRKA
ncbi:MAG: glycosyltransferase family 2 protein [Thermodesulfobacteriota bacterium]